MRYSAKIFRLFGLLLIAAWIMLWIRSFFYVDGVALFDRAGDLHGIASDRGTILLFSSEIPYGPDRAWSHELFSVAQSDFRTLDPYLYNSSALRFRWAGFKICSDAYTMTNTLYSGLISTVATWPYKAATIPDWFLTAIVAIPALRLLLRAWTRRRRRSLGLCFACGYDLRGSPGRCPECSAIPVGERPR